MIYQRYLSKEILKTFCLFLFSFYFVYVAMDYSTHVGDFISDQKIDFAHFMSYYGFHFIKRSELLFPLALLIATIRVLLSMNQHGELTALQVSGIPSTTILRPFLVIGLAATACNYASMEYILPKSLNYLDSFENRHFKNQGATAKEKSFNVLYLTDGSKLFYQKEDASKQAYFDVFWVRSSDELFRMKYLSKDLEHPFAQYVDHIIRDGQGRLEKVESFDTCHLISMHIKKATGNQGTISPENKRLSQLFYLLKHPSSDYLPSEILTHLLMKLSMPLLCLVSVLAPIPFCIRHSRNTPVFLIYTVSLFGLITFFTCMNGVVILGENHTMSPFLAILTPFIAISAWIGWKFKKEVFA